MNYQAIADELSEAKYASFRDDPETCITIMQAESTYRYQAFEASRWSEDIRQLPGYKANLEANRDSTKDIGGGQTLGQLCTSVLDLIAGKTLSQMIDYADDDKRANMQGVITTLLNEGIFDLVLQSRLNAHGTIESNTWIDLGSPNEGDILTAWELVP